MQCLCKYFIVSKITDQWVRTIDDTLKKNYIKPHRINNGLYNSNIIDTNEHDYL